MKPRVAYLTAGAANMFCGSCLRDNTLAAELLREGCEILLIPTYTPIRTDEKDVSTHRIFYGGINVYLQQKLPLFRYLPRALDRVLDQPWLVNGLARNRIETDASKLGDLTVSILQGEDGNQRKEVARLVDWLASDFRPNLINFTNIMVAASAPALKKRLGCSVVVTLQGDDLFLDGLLEPYRTQALKEIRRIARHVDRFIVFTRFYAGFMSEFLGLPPHKISIVPLGVALDGYSSERPPVRAEGPWTVGYLARVCPEKGFHLLVDAFLRVRRKLGPGNVRLKTAGWLGKSDCRFYRDQETRILKEQAEADFAYEGVLDRPQKLKFLRSLDLFSVPTVYREPKGLFVLESLASGVPVVQPAHGSFPELLADTGGGELVRPNDSQDLAECLERLLSDPQLRTDLAARGVEGVRRLHGAEQMASSTLRLYRELVADGAGVETEARSAAG